MERTYFSNYEGKEGTGCGCSSSPTHSHDEAGSEQRLFPLHCRLNLHLNLLIPTTHLWKETFLNILYRAVFHQNERNYSLTHRMLDSISDCTCCLRESLQLLSSQWTCACFPSWSWEFFEAASAYGSNNPWRKDDHSQFGPRMTFFCLLLFPTR